VQLARIQHLRIGDKAFARDELPSLHARMLAGHAERAAAGEG
jgi:hypothetical protein